MLIWATRVKHYKIWVFNHIQKMNKEIIKFVDNENEKRKFDCYKCVWKM